MPPWCSDDMYVPDPMERVFSQKRLLDSRVGVKTCKVHPGGLQETPPPCLFPPVLSSHLKNYPPNIMSSPLLTSSATLSSHPLSLATLPSNVTTPKWIFCLLSTECTMLWYPEHTPLPNRSDFPTLSPLPISSSIVTVAQKTVHMFACFALNHPNPDNP